MSQSPSKPNTSLTDSPFARPDFFRDHRKGVPEVVLTSTKTVAQSLEIAARFLETRGRAILSHVSPELQTALEQRYADGQLEWHPASRMAVIRSATARQPQTNGIVGVITAGTSDQPIAEEAAILCQEMGCTVHTTCDVGVAGLHRLFAPLRMLIEDAQVDVIIVAAGMDGALPSVVSGLVDVPVIGLPTSIGYGMGGRGEAALLAMLQTCSPGLAVVNIDNGVGAGAIAGLIANRAARARSSAPEEIEP